LRIHVRLTPASTVDRIDGWGRDEEGRAVLLARVRARPVEGEANAALEALLAKALGVPKRSVSVARGGRSRIKAVEVDGVTPELIAERLGRAGAG